MGRVSPLPGPGRPGGAALAGPAPDAVRVVLYTKSSPWGELRGGGQLVVHNLAQALVKAGHDCAVVYTCSDGPPATDPVSYPIHWAVWGRKGWSFVSVPRALAAAARSIGADVVMGLGEEMVLGGWLARATGVPWVMGAHHPLYYPIGPWMDLRRGLGYLLSGYQLRMYVHHAALRRAPLVVAPSRATADRLVEVVGVDRARIRVVPNGVDPAWFEGERSAAAAGSNEVVFFGRLDHQKGLDLLIEAFARALARHPGLVLRILGSGEPFEGAYRLRVERLGIASSVRFEGWQGLPAIRAALAGCRLCVLPSRYESFGIAILEAMATGAPVVTARRAPLTDLVQDGRTGFLFEPEDAASLERTILTALADPAPGEDAGRRAREKAAAYVWRRVADDYVAVFTDFLEARRVGP